VDGRGFFVDKGQFTADVRAVVVTVRGILNHFAQQGARATEWYLRKIVVMPLSRRGPSARLVHFRQTFVICSHGQESGVSLRPACEPACSRERPIIRLGISRPLPAWRANLRALVRGWRTPRDPPQRSPGCTSRRLGRALIKRRHPEVQAEIDRVYQEHLAKLGKRERSSLARRCSDAGL
jgi:hypothetical protein